MKNSTIVFLFLLFPFLAVSQSNELARMVENHEFLTTNYPQSKVFLHTDKPYYVVSEDLWYAAYVVNSTDYNVNPVSEIIHVFLENPAGERIAHQSLKLKGKFAHGDFKIGAEWDEGMYTLKAYTSFMKNFDRNLIFSKEISVLSNLNDEITETKSEPEGDLSLRFFPEGGQMVNGLFTKVAFEVSDKEVTEITILDKDGAIVSSGKTIAEGLGYFSILPEYGKKYHVEIGGEKFTLPKVDRTGFAFNVNALGEDYIYIDLLTTEDKDLSETFIIGHVKGLIFLQQENPSGKKVTYKIDKSTLPEGVSQVTLFDKKGAPLLERTLFVQHADADVTAAISIPYEYMNKRQNTEVKVELKDQENNPTDGQYSVSIVDNEKVIGLQSLSNIRTYLLLSSEFTDGINNVGQFFGSKNAKSRFMMDILMLTKGWTRFKWDDVKNKKEPKITDVPENGFTISGQVLRKGKPIKATVELLRIGTDLFTIETETDANGYFRIFSLHVPANSNLKITASILGKNDKKKTTGIELKLDDHLPTHVKSTNKVHYDGPSKDEIDQYINTVYQIQTVDSMFDGMSVQIEEIGISASRKEILEKKQKKERNILHTHYDKRVYMDSLKNVNLTGSVFDLVRTRVPGVSVNGPSGSQVFRIRGGNNSIMLNNDAVVLIDGVPTDYGLVNNLRAEQVEFIDVLRGLSSSAIYSTPNGVVAIYTRQGVVSGPSYVSKSKNVVDIIHEGYYSSREFYSPDYGKAFAGSEKPDLRTTLYWNPAVISQQGRSAFSFYSGDVNSSYLIELQGLSADGIPFVSYQLFEVR